MTGNCKNSGWEKRVSIRVTRKEDSKIYLDLLRILSAIQLTKLIDGCSPHQNYSLMVPYSMLHVFSTIGNKFQMTMHKLTMF